MSDKKPWYENNRFWEATQPFLFSERIMSIASEEAESILKLLDIDPGANILDLCCGPGRHSIEFARRGYKVTGVDRFEPYLKRAEEKTAKENLDIEFVQDDMRRFFRPDTFDAVVNYFTSFGYFDNPDEEKQVIDNIYASLKPGGKLLLELVGKEIIARIYQPRDWGEKEVKAGEYGPGDWEEGDSLLLLDERKPVDNWTYMENRRILIKDNKREEFSFKIRLYSAYELTALLKSCGFTKVDLFGDIEGAPYDHKAKRLIAVAKK